MGSPAARKNDLCSGHDGYPPRPNSEGSSDVFINGRPAHRKGDGWKDHCKKDSCHKSVTDQGSNTVKINKKKAARVGDKVKCGSTIVTGATNVNIG